MPRRSARVGALLLPAALAACGGVVRGPENPARLRLVNMTGFPVSGAVVRFDREIVRVDHEGGLAFPEVRLRLEPPDTLRLAGAELEAGGATAYRVAGAEGPPRVVEARWLTGGRTGPRLAEDEIELR